MKEPVRRKQRGNVNKRKPQTTTMAKFYGFKRKKGEKQKTRSIRICESKTITRLVVVEKCHL